MLAITMFHKTNQKKVKIRKEKKKSKIPLVSIILLRQNP